MLGTGAAALQDPPATSARAALHALRRRRGRRQASTSARKAAGADVSELSNTDYGSREYHARDLEGNHWSFGTYVPDPQAAAASPDSA